ncbi:MAG: hypothetical protein JSS07_11010 [Proteobacteria bacterium]|nr:hypothetical protein [Pseudomonadota bacterium]
MSKPFIPVEKEKRNVKLEQEIAQISKNIEQELIKAMEDKAFYDTYKERIKKENEIRELAALETQREFIKAQYDILMKHTMALVDEQTKFFDDLKESEEFQSIVSMSEQFNQGQREVTLFDGLSEVAKSHFDNQIATNVSSIKNEIKANVENKMEVIKQHVGQMQRKFEEEVQNTILDNVKSKIEDKTNETKDKIQHMVTHPAETLAEHIVDSAKSLDKKEENAISNAYKLANFLNQGEFEVSLSQKVQIFFNNFSSSAKDTLKFGKENPKTWEAFCQDMSKAFDEGDDDKIFNTVEAFFNNEKDKVKQVIDVMDKALDNAVEKAEKDENYISKLFSNAEKELEKNSSAYSTLKNLDKEVDKLQSRANLAGTIIENVPLPNNNKESTPKAPAPKTTQEPTQQETASVSISLDDFKNAMKQFAQTSFWETRAAKTKETKTSAPITTQTTTREASPSFTREPATTGETPTTTQAKIATEEPRATTSSTSRLSGNELPSTPPPPPPPRRKAAVSFAYSDLKANEDKDEQFVDMENLPKTPPPPAPLPRTKGDKPKITPEAPEKSTTRPKKQ